MLLLTLCLLSEAQRPFVPVAPGETLHVESRPDSGRPIAIIPGLFGAAFTFRKVVPLLVARGYRPIVIEPLGTGFSSRPEKADYSLDAQSHRLAAVLDSLDAGPVLVLAHSLGAAMAYRLALDRPDLVLGIVSLEGGPTEEATTPVFRSAMRYVPWVKLFGGIKLIRRKIRGMLLDSSGDASWVTDGVVLGYTLGESRNFDATLKAAKADGKPLFVAFIMDNEPANNEIVKDHFHHKDIVEMSKQFHCLICCTGVHAGTSAEPCPCPWCSGSTPSGESCSSRSPPGSTVDQLHMTCPTTWSPDMAVKESSGTQ